MKHTRYTYLILMTVMLPFMYNQAVSAQSGGTYDLTWNTVCDGGGGTSEGGSYSLSGTIAQHDAGPDVKTGGIYEHISGFWVIGYTSTGEIYIYCYKDVDDVRIEWATIPGVTLYDVYYDVAPGDPEYFTILDANVTPPYYHVEALLNLDGYYYDVRPAP
ncbi:hypothetical protein JXQ70_10595 [bacterium]|nr:hypothetical protein [bacterium]